MGQVGSISPAERGSVGSGGAIRTPEEGWTRADMGSEGKCVRLLDLGLVGSYICPSHVRVVCSVAERLETSGFSYTCIDRLLAVSGDFGEQTYRADDSIAKSEIRSGGAVPA